MIGVVLAASTQRTIGVVLAAVAVGGFICYWIFNWLTGRGETGSETELALNRRPYLDDEELEGKKLDLSLTAGLVCIVIIAVGLPLYWLGEPGRQDGLVVLSDEIAIHRGEELYEERCATCHGTVAGPGGLRDHTLVDENGAFLAAVKWKVPSLGAVLFRYSADEVRYVLNYGRPNTPMPAWGAAGGGPFSSQQIDEIVAYIEHEQIDTPEVRQRVQDGLTSQARSEASAFLGEGASREAVDELAGDLLAASGADPVRLGRMLFNNEADGGVYGCARCHTPGWSYDADEIAENNPLVPSEISGGGGFAPPLIDGSTLRQFNTVPEHEEFVISGSENGVKYGSFGQGDGGGQMPSFSACVGDRDAGERDLIKRKDFCGEREGLLTEDQISAIVAYERQL